MIRKKTEPPRGVLKTDTPSARHFRHERYLPSEDLAVYIEHFWLVEWDLTGLAPERAETLPHPSVHMVFEAGGKSRIGGPSTAKFSAVLEGKGGVFAVKFTPGGFYPFLKAPVSDLANRKVAIEDVFGLEGIELDRAVTEEATDDGRVDLLETFLLHRLTEREENVKFANEIVYAVAKDRDIVKVDDLVERYEINKRSLQRLFATYVGVSPKWVIQRYRLHEAAEQLAANSEVRQTDLALDLGYSDQAHFVRDFKAIVGMSPAAYARKAANVEDGK